MTIAAGNIPTNKLVDLTVRSFPWFSSKLAKIGFLRKTPHGWEFPPLGPGSWMRQ